MGNGSTVRGSRQKTPVLRFTQGKIREPAFNPVHEVVKESEDLVLVKSKVYGTDYFTAACKHCPYTIRPTIYRYASKGIDGHVRTIHKKGE